jgi:hypothetical protein
MLRSAIPALATSRLTPQNRETAALSNKLRRDLNLYALAAGAAGVSVLALTQPAEAEVVYTQVNQTISANQGYAIDLNHDGITDFKIQNYYFVNSVSGFPYNRAFALRVRPAEGVQAGKDNGAEALPAGVKIGPIQPVHSSPGWAVMASQVGTSGLGTYNFGSWLRASDQYLGLAFSVDGEVHFGWARLSVRWNRKWKISATITGYAYETEANKPIRAGDMGGKEAENSTPATERLSAPQPKVESDAMLGALALGADGISVWRRPERQAQTTDR